MQAVWQILLWRICFLGFLFFNNYWINFLMRGVGVGIGCFLIIGLFFLIF